MQRRYLLDGKNRTRRLLQAWRRENLVGNCNVTEGDLSAEERDAECRAADAASDI
jgi:hypothetical protein